MLMALASLRFQRNAQDYEETRQGMTVYAGDAASFHEWQFPLQIKKSLCKAEDLPALTAKVVDALRGEALSCAMEIGLAKLMEANGLDLLVQKVQERTVFSTLQHTIKDTQKSLQDAEEQLVARQCAKSRGY